jgi:hypothetical protein
MQSVKKMIGEFLVKIGAMSPAQVQEVLSLQEKGDGRIFGEIALGLGYLKDDALKRYVVYLEMSSGDAIEPESMIGGR